MRKFWKGIFIPALYQRIQETGQSARWIWGPTWHSLCFYNNFNNTHKSNVLSNNYGLIYSWDLLLHQYSMIWNCETPKHTGAHCKTHKLKISQILWHSEAAISRLGFMGKLYNPVQSEVLAWRATKTSFFFFYIYVSIKYKLLESIKQKPAVWV